MERRFFRNDFEQSLKEHADKFQMVPSKKVWHGIYNDLHPGKRWPSVTMSLLLIFTLVVIGHLNTNNSRQPAYVTSKISKAENVKANVKKAGSSKNNQRIVVRKTDLDRARGVFVYIPGQTGNTGVLPQPAINNYQTSNLKTDQQLTDNLQPLNSGSSVVEKNSIPAPPPSSSSGEENLAKNADKNETLLRTNIDLDGIQTEMLKGKIVVNHFDYQLTKKTLTDKKNTANEDLSADKNKDAVISPKSTPNAESNVAQLHKKRSDKISWVYFAAPVVSSVAFSGRPIKESPGINFSPALPVNQNENKVLHHSALGLEAGAQMNYSFTKKLQFTAGVHLTYSGYHIISNEVHPTFATLVLKDPATGMTYSRSFITHYGDGTGQSVVTIHNYNLQASIPFGLQYEVFGNDKVQFNIATDLEPSVVLKSKAYVLSSDGNNYVNDPSLLRPWNLNSNFGAFVTFSSTKFKWQIGPNVRYQWLSTYQKDYTVKEHLINYGIRIGISK